MTDALINALARRENADFTIATRAFRDNQRTVCKEHLFIGDVPLNESGTQNHPLTPMTDFNLACCNRNADARYGTIVQTSRIVNPRCSCTR